MNLRDPVKHVLKILGHALGLSLHERLNQTDRQLDVVIEQNNALARSLTALLQGAIHLSRSQGEKTTQHGSPAAAAPQPLVVDTDASDYEREHPEIGLIEFLYSYLPSRTVLDIGAADIESSRRLRAAGYEICTAGGERSRTGIALVRIEAEGSHLGVIRGLGDHQGAVVVAGFGGKAPDPLEALVSEMRRRDYFWHITIFRIPSENRGAFQANPSRPLPNSAGRVFFFREFALFQQAHRWCETVLPRAFVRPASTS